MITHVAIKSADSDDVYVLPKPNRHNHVIHLMYTNGINVSSSDIQGFMTEDGDFLDRKEALVYATECGQVKDIDRDQLYSEDLW